MTTWVGVSDYLHANYKIAREREGQIALILETTDGRSQQVSIDLELMGEEPWICITSGFGEVGQVNLENALAVIDSRIFGAIGRAGNFYVVKHSAPVADMSVEELALPMHLTASIADEIESKVGIGDRF